MGLRLSVKRPNCSIVGMSSEFASMALEEAFAFITHAEKTWMGPGDRRDMTKGTGANLVGSR